VSLLVLTTTVSIWQVGDCGVQIYQTVAKLKRATALEFTTINCTHVESVIVILNPALRGIPINSVITGNAGFPISFKV